MMRDIFKDKNIEQSFREMGYVVIPFIDSSELDKLKEQLKQFKPSDNFEGNQETLIGKQSFHITFFDSDYNYKKEMLNFTRKYFQEFTTNILNNYKCVQANAFIKPAQQGFVFPHQNLTIVDESKYNSMSLWLPLQDTNFENGTVCVIPKTQNIPIKYRNTHIYWPYADYCMTEEGQKLFIPINVKKGELLIIDDRLIHYTPINKSQEDRWVLHSLWAPQEAQIKYFDKTETHVKIYNVDDNFWQYTIPGKVISGQEPNFISINDETIYSNDEFVSEIRKLEF